MERRFFPTELRAEGNEGERTTLAGYAAVFDQLSVVLYGMFREKISRGAFAGALSGDVRALWNHDTNLPLGRTKAGTLRLEEDAHGLRVEIDPPTTQAGRDALVSVQRGDVDQMSFGFRTVEDRWDIDAEEQVIRTLQQVKSIPVEVPAGVFSRVRARSVVVGMQPSAR